MTEFIVATECTANTNACDSDLESQGVAERMIHTNRCFLVNQ